MQGELFECEQVKCELKLSEQVIKVYVHMWIFYKM